MGPVRTRPFAATLSSITGSTQSSQAVPVGMSYFFAAAVLRGTAARFAASSNSAHTRPPLARIVDSITLYAVISLTKRCPSRSTKTSHPG